jgi:hypothetical protein
MEVMRGGVILEELDMVEESWMRESCWECK